MSAALVSWRCASHSAPDREVTSMPDLSDARLDDWSDCFWFYPGSANSCCRFDNVRRPGVVQHRATCPGEWPSHLVEQVAAEVERRKALYAEEKGAAASGDEATA